jgi:short subunit dehydrogenase-like uncharacterized protein
VSSERPLDVVVFGASGITGREVAAYLAERAPETDARWAAAGRDRSKVEATLAEAGTSAPEVIVADASDRDSLLAMARVARVVLNLVGPYTRRGGPVIEACVEGRAHYVDLTGEIPFVRRMIDRFHGRAADAGVKVVQVCGFEALPPDLAVALAAEAARARWDEPLAEADLVVSVRPPPGAPRPSDLISGGTAQTFSEVVLDEDPASVTDPAALVDDPARAEEVRRRSPLVITPRRGPGGEVLAPMAPAAYINPAIIHRSAALAAAEAGDGDPPFAYREGFALGGPPVTAPLRWAAAGALAGVQAAAGAATRAQPTVRRRVGAALEKVLPGSGFGPSGERMKAWRWRMRLDARTAAGRPVSVSVEAEGHPGYLATARILGEAGLLLAEPGATPDRGGCLTPAIALGTASAPRFERAQVRFAVEA